MNESTNVSDSAEESQTEVELSALDLFALSNSQQLREPKQDVQVPSNPSVPKTGEPTRQRDARRGWTNRHAARAISAIAVLSIGVTAYMFDASDGANSPTESTFERAVQLEQSASNQTLEPIRLTNPFDKSEVFEFPPGTSEAEARDTVAALLTERALSRQKT